METRSRRSVSRKTISSFGSIFSRKKTIDNTPPESLHEPSTPKRQSTNYSTYSAEAQAPRFYSNRGPSLPSTPSLSWSESTADSQSSICIRSPLPTSERRQGSNVSSEFDQSPLESPTDEVEPDMESSEPMPAYLARFQQAESTNLPDSFNESRMCMMEPFSTNLRSKSDVRLSLFSNTTALFRPLEPATQSSSEDPVSPCSVTGVKRTNYFGRRRSNSVQIDRKSTALASATEDHYRTRQLPALPDWSVLLARQHATSRKQRVTRREIMQQPQRESNPSSRRGSCPQNVATVTISGEALASTSSNAQSDMVEHMLGALCVLYWLANNRRFFDVECEALLQRPGSACLSIDHSVIGFEREFPQSRLETHRLARRANQTLVYASLPYKDNSFDVITARGLTSIVADADWPQTIDELIRVLRPGGRLELVTHDQWVNEGPISRGFTKKFSTALAKTGFSAEQTKILLPTLKEAQLTNVQVANLAIPISWGGRCAAVWHKYYEPLRIRREENSMVDWTAQETPELRYEAVRTETIACRSARTLCVISATK